MINKFQKFIPQLFRDLTSLGSLVFFAWILLFVLAMKEFSLFLQLVFGTVFTLIMVVFIRMVYFKNRPNKQNHSNFIERMDASSFPSLHSARIVFLAITLASFFKTEYVTIFFTIFAVLVMYSRYYLRKHDLWDILGGILLGLLTFWLTTFFF
jgi:undecaprenyl-diphosphatase